MQSLPAPTSLHRAVSFLAEGEFIFNITPQTRLLSHHKAATSNRHCSLPITHSCLLPAPTPHFPPPPVGSHGQAHTGPARGSATCSLPASAPPGTVRAGNSSSQRSSRGKGSSLRCFLSPQHNKTHQVKGMGPTHTRFH